MAAATTKEQRYFDSLKRLASFDPPERLRRSAEKTYGLPYEEVLEMAYENMQALAAQSIKGHRRPADAKPTKRSK